MKRLGYNWKARQKKRNADKKSHLVKLENGCGVVYAKLSCSLDAPMQDVSYDANAEILPSKKRKLVEEDGAIENKRKKLSGKRRKQLLKVIEAKEKKAKVCSN